MTPREKALRGVWRRWGQKVSILSFEELRAALDAPELLAESERTDWNDDEVLPDRHALARVVGRLTREIAAGVVPFCELCENFHPPIGPGQPLMVPTFDEREAARVVALHGLDEVRRAGPQGVPVGVVMSRLRGEPPS